MEERAVLSMVTLGTTSSRERYCYRLDSHQLINVLDTTKINVFIEYIEKENKAVKVLI